MQKLFTAIIQTQLSWEDIGQNLDHFTKRIKRIDQAVDLILLPEMFTTGFTMQPEKVAETMDGKTVQWLQKTASECEAAISGSVVIKENGKYFNRLFFVRPDGNIEHYDKRHTFTLAGEDKVYTAGMKQLLVQYKGWRIFPLICYDLRFPVWSRNTVDYDLVFYVANWPKPRIAAWDTLLKARAIENMSYSIGVNRIGKDPKNTYNGHSAAYDALGQTISTIAPDKDSVEVITLVKNHLATTRKKFRFLEDGDEFIIS